MIIVLFSILKKKYSFIPFLSRIFRPDVLNIHCENISQKSLKKTKTNNSRGIKFVVVFFLNDVSNTKFY